MSIIAQPRRYGATNLRIAIWSAFLLVLVVPLLLQRAGHPYYGALLLRPGLWILIKISPAAVSDRSIAVVNFCLYTLLIYFALRILRSRHPGQ